MNKFTVLLIALIIGPLVAGLYGVAHDQITYTLSPEYYTKFKFIQFGLWKKGGEALFAAPRWEVAKVGWRATWWVGAIIGLTHGLVGLTHINAPVMADRVARAFILALLIAAVCGLLGYFYGRLVLSQTGVTWRLPRDLIDKSAYIAVGATHNFGYIGGALGLILGIVYQWRSR